MKPRFSFSFRETRFLFLETQDLSLISLNMFFFRFFRKTSSFSIFFESPTVFRFFRKPTSPPLPLREGPPLSPSPFPLRGQGMCQPPYSVLKPLRYKVGGPSEVFASSGAAFCGMRPHGYESLTGCRKALKPITARPEPTVTGRSER